ncbi:sensor histidine kinase [Streptomyces sp. NPDC057694]|uniref:sensor histidine kinase n=1 Tax=unclassified Streptomyces TaxID=2593676 RepID=UPI0036999970
MARVRWRDRSKIERVEWQSRFTLAAVNWLFLLAWSGSGLAGSLRGESTAFALGIALVVVNIAQCLVAGRHTGLALDQYLGRGQVPRALTATAGALTVVAFALIAAIVTTDSNRGGLIAMPLLFAPMPFGGAYSLMVPVRRFVRESAVVIVVVLAVSAALGNVSTGLIAEAAVLTLGAALALGSYRCSAWNLSVMWESERARETKALLAVAEERLRFGRDLHDVMGRNLSVVALKSELAVQLARRGRTEAAVAQMVEVQRIARESQKEVRDVVRGYREADLTVELAGAQGVLDAAGITCTVTGTAAGLPDEVQAALGWVVREATTNVLRHGDAKTCRVELETEAEEVVLTVENDGAGDGTESGSGSGLAGLRERLAVLDGELTAGAVRKGVFRVRARVPLPGAAPDLVHRQERESAR